MRQAYWVVWVDTYAGRKFQKLARAKNFGSPQIDRALDLFGQAASMFFSLLPPNEGRANFAGRTAFLEENEDSYELGYDPDHFDRRAVNAQLRQRVGGGQL